MSIVILLVVIAVVGLFVLFVWREKPQEFSGASSARVKRSHRPAHLSPQEAYALIQEQQGNADFVILDVRTATEFKHAFIENAVNLDFYSADFQNELKGLDPQKAYLIYCRSGKRSAKAQQLMQKLGFVETYNMTQGINGWSRQRLPLAQ